MAGTLSVQCVSRSVHLILTYYFVSEFFRDEERRLNSPRTLVELAPFSPGLLKPLRHAAHLSGLITTLTAHISWDSPYAGHCPERFIRTSVN